MYEEDESVFSALAQGKHSVEDRPGLWKQLSLFAAPAQAG